MNYVLCLLVLLVSISANALNEIDKQSIFSKNLLQNGGFESSKAKWSLSAGSFSTTTSSPMMGNVHATWDATASGQILSSTAVAIKPGMYGRNGVASCLIKVPSGTATHTLQAYDGTNILSSVAITSSTLPVRTSANFVFPSSGNISLRIYSNQDEPSISIDDCYLGPAEGFNVVSVSQATFAGGIEQVGATGCNYSQNTSTGLTDFDALGSGSGCNSWTASGDITATGTNEHSAVYNNMPPGNYKIEVSGGFESLASGSCLFALSDGTSTYQPQLVSSGGATGAPLLSYSVPYTSAGSRTLSLVTADNQASGCQIRNDNAGSNLSWKFYRYPLSSEQAYTPDLTAQSWSGYHDNTCSWARTNTAYGDPTADATCALVERTNTNFGTVVTYDSGGSALPGITFTPKRAGKYWVCAIPTVIGTAETTVDVKLHDGTTVIDERQEVITGTQKNSAPLCGIYNATSTSAVTLSIQSKVNSGTVTIAVGSTNANAVSWSIIAIDNQTPAPLLVNSVVTSANAVWAHESASISKAGVVSNESGNWIDGDCSVATTSYFTCTFQSGIFSAAPNCVVAISAAAGTIDAQVTAVSSSSVTVRTYVTSSDANSAQPFALHCHGPR